MSLPKDICDIVHDYKVTSDLADEYDEVRRLVVQHIGYGNIVLNACWYTADVTHTLRIMEVIQRINDDMHDYIRRLNEIQVELEEKGIVTEPALEDYMEYTPDMTVHDVIDRFLY